MVYNLLVKFWVQRYKCCKCDDKYDVLQRRNHFIGQANNVFLPVQDTGYAREQNCFSLSAVYDMYGSELWSFELR